MLIMQKNKKKVIIGLKKARTSLDKIIGELEENNNVEKNNDENKNGVKRDKNSSEEKCFNIIQQTLAVVGLLKSANIAMLENQLDFYVESINQKKMSKKKLESVKEEIVRVVKIAQDK